MALYCYATCNAAFLINQSTLFLGKQGESQTEIKNKFVNKRCI